MHWRAFLQNLVARGLSGVQLIISDDHAGLKAARQAVFGGIPWQRCQFHLQQNALAYVPREDLQAEVAADLRSIINAPDRPTSDGLERLNREIRRRTAVVSIFPNEAACLRLSSAVLMEIDEEWQTGKIYLIESQPSSQCFV